MNILVKSCLHNIVFLLYFFMFVWALEKEKGTGWKVLSLNLKLIDPNLPDGEYFSKGETDHSCDNGFINKKRGRLLLSQLYARKLVAD